MATLEHDTYVPFCFTYKHIMKRPNHTARPRYYRRTSLSCPPVVANAFEASEFSETYTWAPGVLRRLNAEHAQNLTTHSTSSIFWCSDHRTFLTVPYDCTAISVEERAREDELDSWERLRFGHESLYLNNQHRAVSVVGHRYPEDNLAAVGPPSWVPQLIPNPHQRNGSPAPQNASGTSLLAGDLSILLGLAALSTTPDTVPLTIQQSFRPTESFEWLMHNRESFGSMCLPIKMNLTADQVQDNQTAV